MDDQNVVTVEVVPDYDFMVTLPDGRQKVYDLVQTAMRVAAAQDGASIKVCHAHMTDKDREWAEAFMRGERN